MKKIFFIIINFLVFLSIYNLKADDSVSELVVSSNGSCMYLCNAGIRHAENSSIYQDEINATYADYVDNTTPIGATTFSTTPARDSASLFNSVFADDAKAFTKEIVDIAIDLGSENYGSEYFVDFCFRGPQSSQSNNGSNYTLKGSVTVSNFRASDPSAPSYQVIADLAGRAEAKCYLDKSGGASSTIIPGVSSTNYFKSSGTTYTPMTSSASQLALLVDSGLLNIAGDKIPRFCMVRYYFKENSAALRKWRFQKAKVAISTDISDKNGN